MQVCGAFKSRGGEIPKAGSQECDALLQMLKEKADTREKRNTIDIPKKFK